MAHSLPMPKTLWVQLTPLNRANLTVKSDPNNLLALLSEVIYNFLQIGTTKVAPLSVVS